jgi:hypothetical protein
MKLNPLDEHIFSTVAKAKRFSESKIIQAKTDVEAAKFMREAVD